MYTRQTPASERADSNLGQIEEEAEGH